MTTSRYRALRGAVLALLAAVCLAGGGPAWGDSFDTYAADGTITLPGSPATLDVDPSGRLVVLVGSTVHRETASGSRSFVSLGSLPGADIGAFGASFVSVSHDGQRIAVGNNGGATFSNYEVGIFDLATLTGTWFTVNHFDGAWLDDRYVALTAGGGGQPSFVTALDTESVTPATPVNPTLVSNIGGASAGVAFDGAGNLYTGNGFAFGGPSGTGAVYAIPAASWQAALAGGAAVDFENAGVPIIDILSASSLGFDLEGNLLVGGGDLFVAEPDADYFALVRASAVAQALAGAGLIDPSDPTRVRTFDPAASPSNFYAVVANAQRNEIVAFDVDTDIAYVFAAAAPVPAAGDLARTILVAVMLLASRQVLGRREPAATNAQS